MPTRLVFYAVDYTPAEVDIIHKVNAEIISDPSYKYPKWWVDGDTLRFIHEYNFNEVEAVKVRGASQSTYVYTWYG
jgi:hypothetical protein